MGRKLSGPDAARRRYVVAQLVMAVAFSLTMLGAAALMARTEAPLLRGLIAAAPGGVLALWAWEFYRVIRDGDEMMRGHYLLATAVSGMAVLFSATIWGILEQLLGTPVLPGFILLPTFAAVYGLVSAFLSRRK